MRGYKPSIGDIVELDWDSKERPKTTRSIGVVTKIELIGSRCDVGVRWIVQQKHTYNYPYDEDVDAFFEPRFLRFLCRCEDWPPSEEKRAGR